MNRKRTPWAYRNLLRPLEAGLHSLYGRGDRGDLPLLLGALAIVVAVGSQIPGIEIHLAIRDLVDREFAASGELDRLEESFGRSQSLAMIFVPGDGDEGFTLEESDAIATWIQRCEEHPSVISARSALELPRLSASGSPWVEARVADLRASSLAVLGDTPWQGIVSDGELRDAAVEIRLRQAPWPTRYGDFDPGVVGELQRLAEDTVLRSHPNVRLHLSGPAAYEFHALRGVQRFRWMNLAVVGLLLLLMRLNCGRWRAGLVALIPLLIAGAAIYGGMALAGHPIDILSTGLFLLLAVAGIEDFLFLSYVRLRRSGEWSSAFRRLLVPSFLTSLTTVIGFLSLCLADLGMIQRFGLWAAAGAALEWIATFLLLPALLRRLPWLADWVEAARVPRLRWLELIARSRLARPVAVASLLIYAVAAYGSTGLNFNDTLAESFHADHAYTRALTDIGEGRGWMGQMSLVATPLAGEDADDYEARWDRLEGVLDMLRLRPEVAAVLRPDTVLRDLVGDERDWRQQLEELAADDARVDFSELVAEDGSVRAQLFLRDLHLDTVGFVRDLCRALGAEKGVFPAGELVAFADLSERLPRALLRSLSSCLLLVGLLLAFLAGARGRVPIPLALGASLWGPAVALSILWWLQIPINFLSCIFASVLVGLTGDNLIQYLYARTPRFEGGELGSGARSRGAASIQMALTMALCALVFLASDFTASRRLGLLLGAGLLLSVLGDLWILRALIRPWAKTSSATERLEVPS